MSESQRPTWFPRKDYSQIHHLGLDSDRLRATTPNQLGDSEPNWTQDEFDDEMDANPEFLPESSENEGFQTLLESQNTSSSFDLGKIPSILYCYIIILLSLLLLLLLLHC